MTTSDLIDKDRPHTARRDTAGFSLIEVLIAITIFVVIVGIALLFLRDAHKNLETESGSLETQQAARLATDELARNIQQIGYGISRVNTSNDASWQRDVVFAGSHVLAFNADIDSSKGPLSAATTLTFPDGSTYTGQGSAGNAVGAETYIYTIDANGDSTISTADRTGAVSGGFNPAAETPNPLDYGLFRRLYGFDGTGYGGTLVPVTGSLFTNATSTDLYGDGTSPNPLFSYWLTEDLSGDNILDNSECVVTPCPPTATRAPVLYLWGDTDLNGKLSDAEKSALRTLPVGSPSWSKNRLAASGSYYTTTLSVAYNPATGGGTLQVVNAANFGVGEHVSVGTGSSAEVFVVSSVDTAPTPDKIALTSDPANSHAAGESVTILPQTLLRAARTVQISFDSISPKKDYDTALAGAAVGRSGRAGTRGLDYRVRPFERKVELINLTTGALNLGLTTTPNCPTTFAASCSGSTVTALDVFVPRSTTVPVSFVLKDFDGTAMTNKTVTFANSNSSVGTLSAASATTDSSGLATIQYTPTGTNGTDVITASHSCINGSLVTTTMTATLTMNVYKLEVTQTGNDCLQTFRSGYAAPSSAFTVKVKNPAGTYMTNYPVSLTLTFDPAFLPVTPDYTKVTGQLSVGGTSVGVTGSSTGSFGPYATNTQSSGTLSAAFAMSADTTGNGARLLMTAQVTDTACATYGSSTQLGARFYRLALASVQPNTTCTESAPCTIPSNTSPYPRAKATLSINSQAAASVPITFTSDDFVKPASTAKTVLSPSSGWTTDTNGDASLDVYNNNDASITAGSPLKTHIDATTAGPAASCSNGSITSVTLRPEFDYTGPTAVGCDVDLQQAWIKKGSANDKLCIDVKNKDNIGGCGVSITGMQFAVYKSGDNVNVDTTKFKLQLLTGGDDNASSSTCSAANSVQEFIKDCNRFCAGGANAGLSCTANGDCPGSSCPGAADLTNNTRWNFLNYTTKCYLPPNPPNPTDPQNFFVFSSADFGDNIAGLSPKRRFVITVYFQCGGICSAGSVQSKTFDLLTP